MKREGRGAGIDKNRVTFTFESYKIWSPNEKYGPAKKGRSTTNDKNDN